MIIDTDNYETLAQIAERTGINKYVLTKLQTPPKYSGWTINGTKYYEKGFEPVDITMRGKGIKNSNGTMIDREFIFDPSNADKANKLIQYFLSKMKAYGHIGVKVKRYHHPCGEETIYALEFKEPNEFTPYYKVYTNFGEIRIDIDPYGRRKDGKRSFNINFNSKLWKDLFDFDEFPYDIVKRYKLNSTTIFI